MASEVKLTGGYYLFQHRPSDMTCSLHMPDGLHIGNLRSEYAGDFAQALQAKLVEKDAEEAARRAEAMRAKKIAAMEKRIAKLKAIKFVVKP